MKWAGWHPRGPVQACWWEDRTWDRCHSKPMFCGWQWNGSWMWNTNPTPETRETQRAANQYQANNTLELYTQMPVNNHTSQDYAKDWLLPISNPERFPSGSEYRGYCLVWPVAGSQGWTFQVAMYRPRNGYEQGVRHSAAGEIGGGNETNS